MRVSTNGYMDHASCPYCDELLMFKSTYEDGQYDIGGEFLCPECNNLCCLDVYLKYDVDKVIGEK